MNTDVVVVGGGPVGLWTAIQIKTLSGKNVVVLEKHQNYLRADIPLNIQSASLQGIYDEGLRELTRDWRGRVVPIKVMEEALAKRAYEVGIQVLKGYDVNPLTLSQEFPTAKVFIGADGARSRVRKEIFQDQFRFNISLQYVIQVQYMIKSVESEEGGLHSSPKILDLSEKYQMQKFAKHLIVQNIRPREDGSSKVTLQIFVDQATYEGMADATFRTPYYFEKDLNKVPESLKQILIKWWGSRETLKEESILTELIETNKMTVIGLGAYAADEVVKVVDGKVWTLVGDAAQAYPYFRAINNGFLLGTKLANTVNGAFTNSENDSTNFQSSFRSYSRYAYFRATVEKIRAFLNNLFVNLSSIWIKVSSYVPWQVIKLNAQQKQLALDKGNAIWGRLSHV